MGSEKVMVESSGRGQRGRKKRVNILPYLEPIYKRFMKKDGIRDVKGYSRWMGRRKDSYWRSALPIGEEIKWLIGSLFYSLAYRSGMIPKREDEILSEMREHLIDLTAVVTLLMVLEWFSRDEGLPGAVRSLAKEGRIRWGRIEGDIEDAVDLLWLDPKMVKESLQRRVSNRDWLKELAGEGYDPIARRSDPEWDPPWELCARVVHGASLLAEAPICDWLLIKLCLERVREEGGVVALGSQVERVVEKDLEKYERYKDYMEHREKRYYESFLDFVEKCETSEATLKRCLKVWKRKYSLDQLIKAYQAQGAKEGPSHP